MLMRLNMIIGITEYSPDMILAVGDEEPYAKWTVLKPQDLTSTQVYSGAYCF